MGPEDIEDFDMNDVHMYVIADGEKHEIHGFHGLGKTPINLGGNRAWRRSKERNPRDHAKFYRKNQIRPWNE